MSEQRSADPTKAGKLAQQIVGILIDEDLETRRRAIQAAMMLLGENGVSNNPLQEATAGEHWTAPDMGAFFTRDDVQKPADYAQLCAGYHFSLFSNVPFSLDELRDIANEAGIVLPD